MSTITRDIFVNRQDELDRIRRAIESPQVLEVVSIHGEGGMGKTSLLTQVIQEYKERQDLYVTDILDFFSTATHTEAGFLAVLIEQFLQSFQNYRQVQQDYDTVRLAGMPGRIIEDYKQKANAAFRGDFVDLTRLHKAVLLIDTFEVVQDALGDWLLDLLSEIKAEAEKKQAKGVTFIIAGRRNKEWQPDLQQRFNGAVTSIDLAKFDVEAVEELCQQIVEEGDQAIDPAEREKLAMLTEGRPLLLTLALDWRRREGVSSEHLTEVTSQHTLAQLQQMSADALSKVRHTFEAELVAKFNQLQPNDRVILLMSHVYKRFDADILAYLENTSKDEAQARLEEMKWWSFMKYDPRTDTYQLHDKMRDMVSEHVWANLDPDRSQRRELSAQMAGYYERLLGDYDGRIEQKINERNQAIKREDPPAAQASARREEIALRAERNVLAAHHVYYHVLAKLEAGLLHCSEKVVEDIWAFNTGGYSLKQRERAEALKWLGMALPAYITDLERARVFTVIEQNRLAALDLLEKLDDPQVFSLPEMAKSVHYPDVKIYQSINVCYLPPLAEAPPDTCQAVAKWVKDKSPFEHAVELAQEAITILQEQAKLPLNDLEKRAVHRSLARAYGAMAYPLGRMGKLVESIKAHHACQSYARRGGALSAQSHALNDLAYSRARLGQYSMAKDMAEEGLAIRERLGLDYHVGLSLNTLGVIQFMADKASRGVDHCYQALEIFTRLGDRRGLGLAHLTLGKLEGRMAEIKAKKESLASPLRHYEEAEKIFAIPDDKTRELVEPGRLPEVYEWQGVFYLILSDRSARQLGEAPAQVDAFLSKAESYFEKAVEGYEKTGRKWEQAIALERWARVYLDRSDLVRTDKESKQKEFMRVEQKLEQAEKVALTEAPEIVFRPLAVKEPQKETSHPEYRLVLGKIERLRGRMALDQMISRSWPEQERKEHLRKAAKHYNLACAYLEMFSAEARELIDALDQVGDRLKFLEYSELEFFYEQIKACQEEYETQEYKRLPNHVKIMIPPEQI